MYIKFYQNRTSVNYASNTRKQGISAAPQVKSVGGNEYIKPKCIIDNYEKNITNFIKVGQLQDIPTI